MVKREIDALGLKTPVRTLCSGRVKGGAPFGYRHVHNILTNPVYAGRIRHHTKVYPGQHPALISPEIWDGIQEELRSDSPREGTFTRRNRGETKLIIGDAQADVDETLLRNIGLANRYFDQVRKGNTFNEIAKSEGVSKRRIQQLIELAFLAPDVIRSVREGRQPVGMTSDWLKRHAFSPIWSEQHTQFSAL